jgi:hypothetical protein
MIILYLFETSDYYLKTDEFYNIIYKLNYQIPVFYIFFIFINYSEYKKIEYI